MGRGYQHISDYLPESVPGVFVEIGSERGDGSTAWLDDLAGKHNTKLVSVDITSAARRKLELRCTNTEFAVGKGSEWARKFIHTGSIISVLYLDNFDYIWDINESPPPPYIKIQMKEYADRGVAMTNQACQTEHLKQLIELYPRLAEQAVVAFDDTYCYNDCWIGKCGPAVVYLLAHGWKVVHRTLDCGVILRRA